MDIQQQNPTTRIVGAQKRYEIIIDDADRFHGAEDEPWTANIYGDTDEPIIDPTFGRTPKEALQRLIVTIDAEVPAFSNEAN